MNYQEFKQKWLGKLIDYDGYYGGQCFDVVNQYILEMTGQKPFVKLASAEDIWHRPQDIFPDLLKWQRINNTLDFVPQQGDIIVWEGAPWNGNYGHVAICDTSDAYYGTVLQQNGFNPNEGCRLINWNWSTHNFSGAYRLVQNVQPQPPVQNNVIQLTAQLGDGISHLFKRAGRSDFADPEAWTEFAQLNNGQDRVFAGQTYNISIVKINNTPAPQPVAEPTPVQVAPAIVIEGNTATVQPTIQEVKNRVDLLEGQLQYQAEQVLFNSAKKVDNKGRIFGVSKKLTVQLAGAITFMTSLQTVANTELKDIEIAGYPFALWVTGAITLVTAIHTISQSIVDYKEKK